MNEKSGSRRGAVRMEYVIVAVLIAAAIAVAVWLFGAQILGMFQTSGDATCGAHDCSAEKVEMLRDKACQQDVQSAGREADNRFCEPANAGRSTSGWAIDHAEVDIPLSDKDDRGRGRNDVK